MGTTNPKTSLSYYIKRMFIAMIILTSVAVTMFGMSTAYDYMVSNTF